MSTPKPNGHPTNGHHHLNPNGEPSNLAHFPSEAAEGYPVFLPKQQHIIGSLLPTDKFPQNADPPALFKPLTIRGVTFPNRSWVAPMCMYSSDNGHATDFHLVHLGSMAMRGWGNIMVEATSVTENGRISPEDAGLWTDSQIAPLKKVVDFCHGVGAKIGIQLAHAGRKASTLSPWVERQARENGWEGGSTSAADVHGWPDDVVGPSALSFQPGGYPDPRAASSDDIINIKQAFIDATDRCTQIGFDFVEIHGAHGYLNHEFTDPTSNTRTDQYGGSLENRLRLPLEIAKAVRERWEGPLFYRLSASDWLDEALGPEKGHSGEKEEYAWWGIEQTTILTQKLADMGVDLIDVSSGGNDLRGKIDLKPSYQVPFAEHVKKAVPNILVGTVGLITTPEQANDILEQGQADVCMFARQVLRQVDYTLEAALQLGAAVAPAVQYERAWSRMMVPRDHVNAEAHHKGRSEVEGEDGRDSKEGRGSKQTRA